MRTYTLIAQSKNTNAFGLREHLFLAPDGTGWRALRSLSGPSSRLHPGDSLEFDPHVGPASRNRRHGEGWEASQRLASCPPALAARVIREAQDLAQAGQS